jgi:hypothetical protein
MAMGGIMQPLGPYITQSQIPPPGYSSSLSSNGMMPLSSAMSYSYSSTTLTPTPTPTAFSSKPLQPTKKNTNLNDFDPFS